MEQLTLLLRSLLAGGLVWLVAIILVTSFAALIFQGRLAAFYGAGIGIALVSAIVITLVVAVFGSDHATIAYPQSTAAAILAAMAANIAAAAPSHLSDEALFLTVMLTISLSAMIAGLFFAILGVLRAGNLIRYIPYPVIGGFMAGSGWLLVRGAMQVMLDQQHYPDTLPAFFAADVLFHWLPGLVLGLMLLWLMRRTQNALFIPAVVIGGTLLFYGVALNTDNMASLTTQGWFMSAPVSDALWQPPQLVALAQVDGGLVVTQASVIAALLIVSSLHLLLNASGIELVIGRELDLNRELTVVGVSNAISGILGGGVIGFSSMNLTTLVHRMRADGRFVSVLLALLLLLSLLFGASFLVFLPRVILGGLLLYLALNFLTEWLYDAWFRLPLKDYLVIVVILLVIGFFGFLEGVIVGIAATIFLFVLEYSRISVVKQEFSGQVFPSNLDRPYHEKKLLRDLGQHIWVMRLQGFIFFGTSHQCYQRIQARVLDGEREALLFVILDCRLVRGLDVSAVMDFVKLRQLAEMHGIRLVFTDVTPKVHDVLFDCGYGPLDSEVSKSFDNLDFAMEWCENDLLAHANYSDAQRVTLQEQLDSRTMTRVFNVSVLLNYLERLEMKAGEYIAHEGDEPDSMFFIESGRVDIQLQLENGKFLRLRSMRAGTIIGEVGFYLGRARSASMVITKDGVFYRLTQDALHRMRRENPDTASDLHQFIASVVAERLASTNQLVQAFLE